MTKVYRLLVNYPLRTFYGMTVIGFYFGILSHGISVGNYFPLPFIIDLFTFFGVTGLIYVAVRTFWEKMSGNL